MNNPEIFKKIVQDSIQEMLASDALNKGRYVDVSRIPLICQSIININARLEGIESNASWAVRLILGAIIIAFIGLLLGQHNIVSSL